MSIHTNLRGRLRNTSLTRAHGLLPLYEAVINSIHAVEEKTPEFSDELIEIEIKRLQQTSLDIEKQVDVKEPIIGFKVIDHGVGFNDANMRSFETLDSDYKVDKGCRGVGRLLWLKAFDRVKIDSVYQGAGGLTQRTFKFNPSEGVCDIEDRIVAVDKPVTVVELDGFKKEYRDSSNKTIKTIAKSLLEHCLWYFVRESGSPKMIIKDNDEVIDLDDLYDEYMHSAATKENITVKERPFEITHIKFRSASKSHSISYCAANRLVREDNIVGKIPGLTGRIHDEEGDFVYSCYVSSPFLDDRVRSERTGFDFDETKDQLFSANEISFSDIHDAIIPRIKNNLEAYLRENIAAGRRRVEDYVARRAPKYRPILSRIPEDSLAVDPSISDKDLDLALHKQLSKIEQNLINQGHSIMTPRDDERQGDYQKRLQEYLETAADIKKSDLASYVSHRKVILDLLESALKIGEDGRYSREELIHELIMPMRKDSNDILQDDSNLWLLDERLAFHNYLASDKTLKSMPITSSEETKEPDLCALNICDNPMLVSEGTKLPLASIVVVEIKRPMRNDARPGEDKDPIEQALGYMRRIRQGKITTSDGRPVPDSNEVPGYCYIICDITETIKNRCEVFDFQVTSDHMGFFGFNKQYNSYIEIISFDRLVNSARERNRAFFDKLGLPS